MTTITTSDGTQIFYKDWGPRSAQPIVFHHGWPLSADDWDNQMLFFLAEGFRVIAHDRRGHGRSTQSADGHDMDSYVADVIALTDALVVHRFGRIEVGAAIMMVATAAPHRRAAFEAADFLMDWLKSRAPFRKREIGAEGPRGWVAARDADEAALTRW